MGVYIVLGGICFSVLNHVFSAFSQKKGIGKKGNNSVIVRILRTFFSALESTNDDLANENERRFLNEYQIT